MTLYTYDIKISKEAASISNGFFTECLPNCSNISIISKTFNNFEECERKLNNLMGTLSNAESKAGAKNYVMVSKLNPLLDESDKHHSDASTWDSFTVMRIYIADADELKKTSLKYNMLGQIKVDHEIIGLTPVLAD